MQSIFEILFLVGNPGKISKRKSLFKGNLICNISGTKGCKKFKFGEVCLHTYQNFWENIEENKFQLECPCKANLSLSAPHTDGDMGA